MRARAGAIIAIVCLSALPIGLAGEQQSSDYIAAGHKTGIQHRVPGVAACTLFLDELDCEAYGIGGARFEFSQARTELIVDPDDDIYNGAPIAICLSCGPLVSTSGFHATGCGAVALSVPSFQAFTEVDVHVYQTAIESDTTDVCLGSTGSLHAAAS